MKTKLLILLLPFLTLSSCYFDSNSDSIVGKYEILWIDTPKTRAVSERYSPTSSSVLVKEYVFAVGHNSEFIIVKQHPTSGFDKGYIIDTATINYYVIDIRKESKVTGPMTKSEFEKTVFALKIDHIKFDQTYPEDL